MDFIHQLRSYFLGFLREKAILHSFCEKALNWLNQEHSNWKDTLNATTDSSITIYDKDILHKLTKDGNAEKKTFIKKFCNLELGGILICDFDEQSFRQVIYTLAVGKCIIKYAV